MWCPNLVARKLFFLINIGRRVGFTIIGNGGGTLEQSFRKSNPWKGAKCGRPLCFPYREDKGGDCWRDGGVLHPVADWRRCTPGQEETWGEMVLGYCVFLRQ